LSQNKSFATFLKYIFSRFFGLIPIEIFKDEIDNHICETINFKYRGLVLNYLTWTQ